MTPYVIIGLLVAWGSSLFGVGWWQNDAGHIAERTTWQTRENGELRTANATIKALQEQARKDEQTNAAALAAISNDYERKLSDANKQRAADAVAIRAGTLRLRDPNPTGLRACGGIAAQAAAGTGRRDGREEGELSGEATQFLFDLTADADQVAMQLQACQAVIAVDRAGR